jgi:hypothetical protein
MPFLVELQLMKLFFLYFLHEILFYCESYEVRLIAN